MSTEENKRIVRTYTDEVMNAYRPERAREFVTSAVKWHGGTLGTVEGAQNPVGLLQGFIAACPDLHATEHEILAEGDLVAVRCTIEATNQGDLFGIPATGRPVRWDSVDMYRLVDGKIAEEWAADDALAMLYGMGIYAPPWLAVRSG